MIGNPKYQAAIEEARQETWCHIGEGAARIADYMIGKQKDLKEAAEKAAADKKKTAAKKK